ncbi:ATPase, T2SS/T4P/T4SS family [Paraburkholderia rhizosphaerae]|uniref:Pilus assembly protein CpaF n=1 Tax=Paraburkholderia rhizosphaerae TaxID=480658 RepID=A0A4R8M0E9_9BURK|nr:ATPase, T2SS/T4P/T4SS family [Paraburkholderia rhizosphaerae]TDY54560.1 pilus assembly protein CpaF [Paraburkholderia rhizosphaerae]
MLKLEIHTRNAPVRTLEIERSCTIGRSPDSDIVIKGMLIGKTHARLVNEFHAWYIEDHGGIVATLVNGTPVVRYGPLGDADLIEIGSTSIKVVPVTHTPRVPTATALTDVEVDPPHRQVSLTNARTAASTSGVAHDAHAAAGRQADVPMPSGHGPLRLLQNFAAPGDAARQTGQRRAGMLAVATPRSDDRTVQPVAEAAMASAPINSPIGVGLRKLAHMKVIAALDLRRLNVSRMADDELRATVSDALDELLAHDSAFAHTDIDIRTLKKSVFDEIIGLGPLEALLADPDISEIMVNRHDEIFIEQNGCLSRSPVIFTDDRAVLGAIERIVAPIGRRIDESSPMVDARLKDGSRVNAVIPPLALKGPSITIRKFSRRKLTGADLISFGSMSPDMLEFLQTAVRQRANIVISGGTGSGKTTLLNVLSGYIPDDERIVTVEDAAELQLSQPNLVSLEARPANMEGKGAIPIRDLVRNCLRMRPDRIVVGECRGGEALDMLQAMNTGHDGSLTTAHANSPRDCIARLEVMTLMAGLDLPVQAIREQVCSAVDLIVQQSRFSCGSRRVTHITEVSGMESGVIQLQDVFMFRETGFGESGKIQGEFVPTAYIPDFYQDLLRRRIPVNTDIFTRGE